jgi:hypothetical protein
MTTVKYNPLRRLHQLAMMNRNAPTTIQQWSECSSRLNTSIHGTIMTTPQSDDKKIQATIVALNASQQPKRIDNDQLNAVMRKHH